MSASHGIRDGSPHHQKGRLSRNMCHSMVPYGTLPCLIQSNPIKSYPRLQGAFKPGLPFILNPSEPFHGPEHRAERPKSASDNNCVPRSPGTNVLRTRDGRVDSISSFKRTRPRTETRSMVWKWPMLQRLASDSIPGLQESNLQWR